MAMTMVAHYPDRERLVALMINLAVEELQHFREVAKLLQARGLIMQADEKDPYVNALRSHFSQEKKTYLLDRLLLGAVIEARGEERFRLIAENIEDEKLKSFYQALANSEAGHHELFLSLAVEYYPSDEVQERLAYWISLEAETIEKLPIRSRLH